LNQVFEVESFPETQKQESKADHAQTSVRRHLIEYRIFESESFKSCFFLKTQKQNDEMWTVSNIVVVS